MDSCIECGDHFSIPKNADNAFHNRQKIRSLCSGCMHWLDIIEKKPSNQGTFTDKYVIEKGILYTVKEAQYIKGYGGKKYRITFADGTEVITNTLWKSGEIPIRFRHKLLDNATIEMM